MATRDEAVAAAKQLEVDGRAFYLGAAEKASSRMMKGMFTSLADDERNHLEWLENLAPGVKASRDANRALYGQLGKIFAGAPKDVKDAVTASSSDVEAIDHAIEMEDKSIAAYGEWAQRGESDEVRSLGEVLVGIERFHRQVLENAKEYLQSPGDWFMQEERWNFEGG